MNTKQLLNITTRELNRMTDKELRQAVSVLRSTARKRHERLESADLYSPAEQYLHKSARGDVLLPTVKGMDITRLKNEFSRYSHFLKMKTSTVKGAREVEKAVKLDIEELTGRELTSGEITEIWEITEELQDKVSGGLFLGQHGDTNGREIFQIVSDIMTDNPDLSKGDITEKARERIDEIYEQTQQSSSIYTSKFMR